MSSSQHDQLDTFERDLRAVRPASHVDAGRLMFQAGRAAAEADAVQRVRRWRAFAGVLAVGLLGLSTWSATGVRSPEPIEPATRIVVQAPATVVDPIEIVSSHRVDHMLALTSLPVGESAALHLAGADEKQMKQLRGALALHNRGRTDEDLMAWESTFRQGEFE